MTQLTDGQAKYLAEAQARFQLPEFTDEQLIGELVKRGVLAVEIGFLPTIDARWQVGKWRHERFVSEWRVPVGSVGP